MSSQDDHNIHAFGRKKFLSLSLESTRKSYYPQLKQQLEHAKENERRLQLLIDSMPAQISYVDAGQRIVLVNRQYERAFGLTREALVGRHLKEILGKHAYEKLANYIDRALTGHTEHFEMSFDLENEGTRWFDIHYAPEKTPSGRINGFYTLTIDLTEKKQAQEEQARLKDRLRQAQKMEAIGTLSGGIAHDFNNILSGIFGYSELAKIHIKDPEKATEYIKRIYEGAQRASSLIEQILTFSRQTKPSRQAVNLFSLLTEALKLIRSSFPSNIEIREVFNSKASVLADSTQIHQVIMNLCTNALHAMASSGGILTISLKEVNFLENEIHQDIQIMKGGYALIEVRDTGPGISEEIRDKIFDPYFTTKEVGKGTGLGLAVVNGIIKKHNGFIKLSSIPGKGTRFKVYLPLAGQDGPVQKNDTHENADLTGHGTIMLVDDEAAIIETQQAILERHGYRVRGFDSVISALETFRETPDQFDLVITDMTMPQMTGDILSKEILNIRSEIPVVMCTGYHEAFTKEDAYRLGISAYIRKPVMASEMLQIVRNLLETGSVKDSMLPKS